MAKPSMAPRTDPAVVRKANRNALSGFSAPMAHSSGSGGIGKKLDSMKLSPNSARPA